MSAAVNKEGEWKINTAGAFLKEDNKLLVFLTKQGVFEAPKFGSEEKSASDWHTQYEQLTGYEPKLLAVKEIMMEFRDGEGLMKMAFSGFRGTVAELDELTHKIKTPTDKESFRNLMSKFTFISFNHFASGLSGEADTRMVHFGYSEGGVKYFFTGSLQESDYSQSEPVGTNGNRHFVVEGNDLLIAYDIHDTLDKELKGVYLRPDGRIYKNILAGVGFGPREVALHFDSATLLSSYATVAVNEIGKRLENEQPYKVLVPVYASEQESLWMFEFEATPAFYQKWEERH